MKQVVFKVCRIADWEEARRVRVYRGSPDDLRDGFIHLSNANQLSGTLEKHFAGQPDLVLIVFSPEQLGPALKWEASRGGQLFPHLYGELDPTLALNVVPIKLDEHGRHQIPEDYRQC